jgi:spermidine synthase
MPGSNLWFDENFEIELGRTLRIKIDGIVEQYDSEFQRIEVYQTRPFGKMLVLDGVIMCTEWDEHAYHEMIVHVPMFTHPGPEKVLVIGGGDGGTVREVLKHPTVKRVDLCEIDEHVVRISRKHLPRMTSGLDDKRVKIVAEDGAKFVHDHKNTYDIIIVDSSDPIGPAEVLFSEEFYASMKESLTEGGIAATQSESFYYHGDIVERLTGYAKKLFAIPGYYFTVVPTYPSGIIGFTLCSKKYHPFRDYREERVAPLQPGLQYYNPAIHRAAFALPSFIKDRIKLPSMEK